jgi:thiaminase (transcriptional activator TenA)
MAKSASRLAAEAGQTPYRGWIDTYAGTEYQDVCRDVGQLIDQALERRLGSGWAALPRWQQLCRRFEVATRLEVGFWDMGLRGP